jgi:hypothetical protein
MVVGRRRRDRERESKWEREQGKGETNIESADNGGE